MMLKALLGLAALLGVTVAEPIREKRQAGCIDAFQNVPNVCQNNPSGQLFFAHPTDRTKFMQCDVYSRMFIIQCPLGEEFVAQTSGCQPKGSQTTTTAPRQSTTTTRAPVVVTSQTTTVVGSNPCTPESTARGQLYFSYHNDVTKFYECDLMGHANVLQCPRGLQWDQSILSCVYPVNALNRGTASPTSNPVASTIPGGNPCTSSAVAAGRLFFPHPDHHKFIQCDLWGDFFVVDCPSNLIWNAYLETCYSPFLAAAAGKK